MPCSPLTFLLRSKLDNEKTLNKFKLLYKNNNFKFAREKYSYHGSILFPIQILQIENKNFNTVFITVKAYNPYGYI